jgi:hypothetical protein
MRHGQTEGRKKLRISDHTAIPATLVPAANPAQVERRVNVQYNPA